MKLKGSHWTRSNPPAAGVVQNEPRTVKAKIRLKLDSGHTEELLRDELLCDWVRVTSPNEAQAQAKR